MADEQTPPPQEQDRQPGIESRMTPQPSAEPAERQTARRLEGRTAVVTGGDSGIGRAVAAAFAAEGADLVVTYLDEHDDARETARLVEQHGGRADLVPGDLSSREGCLRIADEVLEAVSQVDVLVNNSAEQHPHPGGLEEISPELLERTFRTNILSIFHLTGALIPSMRDGGSIVNTTSVNAYKGHPALIDYSATKAAIVGFTRSLALSLVERGIRVNAVAPGPVWTPLIPATFPADHVGEFGENVPMGRPGEPDEIAPSFVFLASEDAAYMTGQVLHPNGGTVVNG